MTHPTDPPAPSSPAPGVHAKPPGRQAALLGQAVRRAAARLGLSEADLVIILGLNWTTHFRLQDGEVLDPDAPAGRRAIALLHMYRALQALTGADDGKCRVWLRSHNHALGAVPADLMRSHKGLVRVVSYLEHQWALLVHGGEC